MKLPKITCFYHFTRVSVFDVNVCLTKVNDKMKLFFMMNCMKATKKSIKFCYTSSYSATWIIAISALLHLRDFSNIGWWRKGSKPLYKPLKIFLFIQSVAVFMSHDLIVVVFQISLKLYKGKIFKQKQNIWR